VSGPPAAEPRGSITFLWAGYPWRGHAPFRADTPGEMFLNGLDALADMMGRGPEKVRFLVRVRGEWREQDVSGPMDADFERLADWFDREKDALLARAREMSAEESRKERAGWELER
jgi:hypothetical protein